MPCLQFWQMNLVRTYGEKYADSFYDAIKSMPIRIFHELEDTVFKETGRLKAAYKISLADSIALAQTLVLNGTLITCDHHEFDALDGKEPVKFAWIR